MKGAARQARRRHFRYRGIQLSFFLAVGLMLGRAFQLQVVEAREWRARAIAQHETRVPLPAPRGTLYDRGGRELAVSRTTYRISVAPHELRDRQGSARVLAHLLDLSPDLQRRIARTERPWVVLPGRHSAILRDQIEERVRHGVYFEPLVERFYPHGRLAAEVLGRVDAAGHGAGGIELTYDSILAGQPGFGIRRRDATGASAGWLTATVVAPTAGADLYLTIDAELQSLAESVLEDAIRASGSEGGDLLILRPESGDLLAAASRRPSGARHLTAATDPYEPGSTLKPFIAAALLSEGLAELEDSVDTGVGYYRLAGRDIRDVHGHGWLTLDGVLEVSSNVGIVKFVQRMPASVQYAYLRDFGFGTPTGLAYPSESPGLLRRPDAWSGQSQASLAMGYEVALTPLQLVMAYGAIASGGVLMSPRLVRESRDAEGRLRWQRAPEEVRRVIPEDVATALRQVLSRAVTRGTGRSAGFEGLSVAGKTGTAQRFEARTGYGTQTYTASFVGLVPSDAPELVILVKLDAPSGAYYGGETAAPVMRTALRAALAGSHWPVPPLLGEPALPDEIAGASAAQVPVSGPYIFALDAPLRRADRSETEKSPRRLIVPDVRGLPLRTAVARLHQAGFGVKIRGGGRVTAIDPPPTSRVQHGEHVLLVGDDR